MNAEQTQFMSLLGRPPARLTSEQTAWLLNCRVYDICVLVAARLLRPLGKPEQNAPKFFATSEILDCAADPAWLAKMTATLQQYWRHRNLQKRGVFGSEFDDRSGSRSNQRNGAFSSDARPGKNGS